MSERESGATNQSELQPRSGGPVEPETKMWEGGFSPKAMYGTWLMSSLVTLAVLVGLIVATTSGMTVESAKVLWFAGFSSIIAWWAIALVLYFYRRWGVYYELTSQRFIHSSGLLVRTTDRIDVIDIDDVAFTQGLIQRLLNVGTIQLTSQDSSHPRLLLRGIDDVEKVSVLIDDIRRKERRKRSLHIDTN
ncbi:MAG: PH domain-containing protein [Pirellula sp.]|jgi:membrane protein YdbS with pleckstrin-like domain